MEANNIEKDPDYGLFLKNLRQKHIKIPFLTEELFECVDWYSKHIYSLSPNDTTIETARMKILDSLIDRELKIRDIQDIKLKKEREAQ